MTPRAAIFAFISSLAISLAVPTTADAQLKKLLHMEENDSVPLFNGFAVGVDLAGLVQYAVSDYGQAEASLRLNLLDRYFPVVELGMGMASHDDVVTEIKYETRAPYVRIGADYNLMRDKHDDYRIYGGARYAFTSYKLDFSHPDIIDPVWGGKAHYGADDVSCYCHWLEVAAGVDAKVWGPIHLGWSVRYRRRIAHDSGDYGKSWYVPGFGKTGTTRMGYTFVLSLDI